jgi:uncharacterized protein (TIGR03437 family)
MYRPVLCLVFLTATAAVAQPQIEHVQNAASFQYRGTPGYGIAPGSVFAISGTRLAADADSSVTIRIASGTSTVDLPALTVSPTRITAILPEDFPIGDAKLTLTFGGTTSAGYAFTVAARAFGIATLDGTGAGTAVAIDPDGTQYSILHSANPGETLYLEGTGFGRLLRGDVCEARRYCQQYANCPHREPGGTHL